MEETHRVSFPNISSDTLLFVECRLKIYPVLVFIICVSIPYYGDLFHLILHFTSLQTKRHIGCALKITGAFKITDATFTMLQSNKLLLHFSITFRTPSHVYYPLVASQSIHTVYSCHPHISKSNLNCFKSLIIECFVYYKTTYFY